MKDFRPQYIEDGIPRRYARTLADAFPDVIYRTGIEHYRRPSSGLGFGRVLFVIVIGLLMVGIARAIR